MSEEPRNEPDPRGAAREILLFFLRFLAASIVLYLALQSSSGRYYTRLIALIAKPLLAAFGYELVMDKAIDDHGGHLAQSRRLSLPRHRRRGNPLAREAQGGAPSESPS